VQSNLKLSVQATISQKSGATSEHYSFPQVANAMSLAFFEATAQSYMHVASEPPH
jgi:hypothetical protein